MRRVRFLLNDQPPLPSPNNIQFILRFGVVTGSGQLAAATMDGSGDYPAVWLSYEILILCKFDLCMSCMDGDGGEYEYE